MDGYNCDVRVHGTHQFEIKTRYPIPPEPNLRYDLDVYLFTPGQLQINDRRYGAGKFLDNLKVNTRYTTPGIPLHRLIDESFELSPLTRINRILDNSGTGGAFKSDELLYEIRTLANIYRAELRDTRRVIDAEISGSHNAAALLARIKDHVSLVDAFIKRMRATLPRFIDPHIPADLRTAIEWADESVSLATEVERLKLYLILDAHDDLHEGADLLKPLLGLESVYRQEAGYRSNVDPTDERINEDLLYRESILKKWSQSAMYMSSEPSHSLSRVAHILAGVAAAVAMSFAIVATLLAERLFASYSVPWALVIVFAYIFKDRIKEVLRAILIRLVPRVIADDVTVLVDPAAGKNVGHARSNATFCTPRDLSLRVTGLRNLSENPFRSILPEESVIHYRRRIKIDGKTLQQNHQRLDSITEILRLKLDIWLEEMDNPENDLTYFDEDEIASVVAARVYHVNVIVALTRGGEASYYRFRLILTRNGLVRIETVTAK